jgi:hypothetical protein
MARNSLAQSPSLPRVRRGVETVGEQFDELKKVMRAAVRFLNERAECCLPMAILRLAPQASRLDWAYKLRDLVEQDWIIEPSGVYIVAKQHNVTSSFKRSACKAHRANRDLVEIRTEDSHPPLSLPHAQRRYDLGRKLTEPGPCSTYRSTPSHKDRRIRRRRRRQGAVPCSRPVLLPFCHAQERPCSG